MEKVRQLDGAAVSWARFSNFRCHEHFEMTTSAATIVLHGANGAGKTSILEGLSLLTSSKGIRNGTSDDFRLRNAQVDAPAWSVAVCIKKALSIFRLRIGWSVCESAQGNSRKQITLDGKAVSSYAELTDLFQFIWLTPEMDRVLAESAAKKRRLLDRLICGFDPGHVTRINTYERSLQQRSRLLKDRAWDPAWLTVLEETMVANGIAITIARHEMAERLQESARDPEHVFPEFFVSFEGEVDEWVADRPALEAEDRYRKSLLAARKRDSDMGGASVGPHRSTFYVHLLSNGRRAENCSIGEQKMLVISLVLASIRLLQINRKSSPILLLDDIAAHLDIHRRTGLFNAVDNLRVQAWYTGTDVSVFDPLHGSAEYHFIG